MAGLLADAVSFQAYTPRHLPGRVITGMQLVNYGTIPLGALIGGFLGTTVGLRPISWVMAVALVLSTGILLAGPVRKSRDLPTGAVVSGSAPVAPAPSAPRR